MTDDTNLYFQGLVAKLIQFGGWILIFISFIVMSSSAGAGLFVLLSAIGIIIWGKAKRFEYKRKSGHIIHRGD